jgi:hypothetical protein
MIPECLAGDIGMKINHVGTLISRVEEYLLNEVVYKDPHYPYLARIETAIEKIIGGITYTHSPQITGLDFENLKKIVVEKTFIIDQSWATQEALSGISALADLQDIRLARVYYYAALDNYPLLTQSPLALAAAGKNIDRAMQKVMDICDHNNLVKKVATGWKEKVVKTKIEVNDVR